MAALGLRRSRRNTPLSDMSTDFSTHLVSENIPSPQELRESVFLTPSPDEHIIRQRSRRAAAKALSQIHSIASAEEDEEFDTWTFETPPKTPKPQSPRKRLNLSPKKHDSPTKSPVKASKKQRVQRQKATVPLETELKGLSQDQLIDVIEEVVNNHPGLEQEVRDLMPQPDIRPLKDQLYCLQRNIYKSFPNTRWGSSRDSFCYRRVRTHLETFKKTCIEQGKHLLNAHAHEALFEYLLSAWKYTSEMPSWDNPSHNKSKQQCFKHLASQFMNGLKKSVLEKEQYMAIKSRLAEAVETDSEIEPCLGQIDKILSKLI